MKSIFLVQKEQRVILDRFYDSICRHLGDCELRWMTSSEQRNLKQYFQCINISEYDRIIFFLRFKSEIKQVRFIKTIPNLVILEHDVFQNYIDGCKYQGKFSKHYRALPWARIVSSGYTVTKKLKREGFDAVFVPKGYDQMLLYNKEQERDIELGFLGSTSSHSKIRKMRYEFLEWMMERENLLVKLTKSGNEYLDMLNRIKIFVSADVGYGEYMIKNFEAMACGCVVLAWDQGEEENRALGFKDMENIVLCQQKDEFVEKLALLRQNPELVKQIAKTGQELAESWYSWERLGGMVAESVTPVLRKKKETRWLGFIRYSVDQAI